MSLHSKLKKYLHLSNQSFGREEDIDDKIHSERTRNMFIIVYKCL